MKIFMVCTGNTCRSSMAQYMGQSIVSELIKSEKVKDNVIIESAGIMAFDGDSMSMGAKEALKIIGIDGSSHKSRLLTAEMVVESDLILTMQDKHKNWILANFPFAKEVYTLNEYAGLPGEIKDPYGYSLDLYENTRDMISNALEIALNKALKIH